MKQLGLVIFFSTALLQGCTSKSKVCPEGFNEIALTNTNWENEYKLYSKVIFNEQENTISMMPEEARDPQSTHASLVLSKFNIESDNFDVIVEYKNEAALRKINPNPWEVFWLFFNYVPGANVTKTTNYVIAKTNGVEVGRAAREIDQVYIKTDERFKATFNKWHRLRVQQQNGLAKFHFDDTHVFDTASSVLFSAFGKLGLYSEDAAVTIKRVCLAIQNQK